MDFIRRYPVLPWLVAVIGFPIGGTLGHAVGGPAATIPAAVVSGFIAGAVIGLAQGLALMLNARSLATWTALTGVGLAVALGLTTAVIGQIETTVEAVALGALSGLAIGAGQAAILMREGSPNAWAWIPATGLAWAVGWLVTASIGVALAPGWANYGLSGAIVSQIITGVVLWRVVRQPSAAAA
jgi:hypothetical protein